MATYKRLHLLPRILSAYASGDLSSLHSIILVWQDTSEAPPAWLSTTKYSVPVHIRISGRNSMNERFRQDERIKTQAVFMVDDDLFIQPDDVEHVFKVWKELGRNQRIVGFSPRDYKYLPEERSYQFVIMPTKSYSMILSNAAMMDRSFFDLYWSERYQPFREHVDAGMCRHSLWIFLI